MKKLLVIFAIMTSLTTKAQVYVNDVDLNITVKSFELHMAKKPFTNKDCLYIDYGQKFKEQNYDITNAQSVQDSSRKKFNKGEYMLLLNYLDAQGWIKDSQRESKLGDVSITIILFRRK